MKQRFEQHIKESQNPLVKRAFQRALRKYPLELWISEILDVVDTKSDARFSEKHHIRLLETIAPYGYNMTEGGDGFVGSSHRMESKAQTSRSLRGVKKTYSNGRSGKKLSESHMKAISQPRDYACITEREFHFIKTNMNTMSFGDMAKQLNTDIGTIRRWSNRGEFKRKKKDSSARRQISKVQYDVIQNNKHLTSKQLSELTGLTSSMVKKWKKMDW
jgi:DNA-binding transcriptional regulator YiaG